MILDTNFFGILKSSAVSRDGYTLISVYFNNFDLGRLTRVYPTIRPPFREIVRSIDNKLSG